MKKKLVSLWTLILLLSCVVNPRAVLAADCDSLEADCVAVGDWQFALGIGLGGRTNPIVGGDDQPIVLLPSISYYGERFFWETDTLGYTLLESPRHMLNVIATVSYDQIYFDDYGLGNFSIEGADRATSGDFAEGGQLLVEDGLTSDEGADPSPTPTTTPDQSPTEEDLQGRDISPDADEVDDRNMAGLLGFEYAYENDRLTFGLQVLQDFTGVHHGQEVRLGMLYPLYNSLSNTFVAGIGAEWKDSKTLDYYYGIDPGEVDNSAFVYQADDGVSYYLKLDWRRRLSRRWELRGIVHNRWFDAVIHDSPLVEDKTSLAIFFGGVYHF